MRSSAKSTPDDTSNSLCRVVCVGVCDGTTPSQVIVYTKLCVSDRTAGKRRAIIRGQETCDNNMTGGGGGGGGGDKRGGGGLFVYLIR